MRAFHLIGPALLLMASCDNRGPEMGAGPVFTVFAQGGKIAYSTNPDVDPEIEPCLAGQQGNPGASTHVTRGTGGRDRFSMIASDVSGIRSMRVTFDATLATVHSPDLPIETIAAHGGGSFRAYVYEFADASASEDVHSVSIDLTVRAPSAPGLPISLSAEDGVGHGSTGFFFAGPASVVCPG